MSKSHPCSFPKKPSALSLDGKTWVVLMSPWCRAWDLDLDLGSVGGIVFGMRQVTSLDPPAALKL